MIKIKIFKDIFATLKSVAESMHVSPEELLNFILKYIFYNARFRMNLLLMCKHQIEQPSPVPNFLNDLPNFSDYTIAPYNQIHQIIVAQLKSDLDASRKAHLRLSSGNYCLDDYYIILNFLCNYGFIEIKDYSSLWGNFILKYSDATEEEIVNFANDLSIFINNTDMSLNEHNQFLQEHCL